MDDSQSYEELQELGDIFVAQPESKAARDAMEEVFEQGGDVHAMLAASREHLAAMGVDAESFLSTLPPELLASASPEQVDALKLFYEASFAGAIAQADESGEAPALLEQVVEMSGIVVHEQEIDGETVKVVQATIFPFINPEKQIARLIETCYQVYPPEAFSRPKNALRDSQWFRRSTEGETCREIALTDERSGLAPEAAADPAEYKTEVATAENTVYKAVERFKERWTQKLTPVSGDFE